MAGGLFLTISTSLFAQERVVQGNIKDNSDGLTIPGVNILIQGTTQGSITDLDGNYQISVPDDNAILVYSFVGYKKQEVTVGSRSVIDISLSLDVSELSEVVVIGYGAVRKRDLTGVVTKITTKEFNRGVIASPERLLTGKVAGVQISNNGEPGGSSKIRIRGGSSLGNGTDGGSNDPLFVIDGVPLDYRGTAGVRNPLSTINPEDIQDITVLKDASAAAIYGARGANGVIIITTKPGQKGKLKVNYDGFVSISSFNRKIPVLSANQFRAAIDLKSPGKLSTLGESNTKWVDEITESSIGQKHSISLSGGTNKSTFYASIRHLTTDGVLKTTQNKNTNISLNFSTKLLNDNLKINLRTKNGFTNDVYPPNAIGAALTYDPTQPVFDEGSVYGGYNQWSDPLAVNNPVSSIDLTDDTGKSFRNITSLRFDYSLPFIEGLTLSTNLSYDVIDGEKTTLKVPTLKDSETFVRNGFLHTEDIDNETYMYEVFATYKKNVPSINSSFNFTAGHSLQHFSRENRWTDGNGLDFSTDEGNPVRTVDVKSDSLIEEYRLASFFGRLNYSYKEKYLLTFSLRRDGSSKFGAANRWGLFPSAAFAWRILDEGFASGLNNTFSNLKLRVSYGVTGNETIPNFLFATFYGLGTDDSRYQFGDDFTRTLRGKGVDSNIKWEETTSINYGLDFGLFGGRLTGSAEVYVKKTNDLLFKVTTSAFTNLSDRVITNISELENKGVELNLNSVIIDKEDLTWNLGFNISYNKNEIVKLDNSNLPEFLGYETGGISGDVGQTIQILKVGESVEAFRMYRQKYNADGTLITDTEDANGDGLINALDLYEDINGDGTINENDLVVDKKPAPDVMMGLTSNIRYKNFDLSFTFRANLGNYVYNNVASSTGYFDRLTDRVTNNIHKSAFTTNFKERQLKSNYYLEDASFLKLDNITLSYSINNAPFFRSMRVYTTIQNIMTITGYSGLDPESPQFKSGIDNDVYPVSTTYLLGLNVSF